MQQSGRFPDLYIATVAAGERSGHLDLILDQLSDYTENRFAKCKRSSGFINLSNHFNARYCDGFNDLCCARDCKNFDQNKDAFTVDYSRFNESQRFYSTCVGVYYSFCGRCYRIRSVLKPLLDIMLLID